MEPQRRYPTYQFRNAIVWKSNHRGLLSAEWHPSVEVGSPPEFKGTPDVWCPEDLLIGALNTCLMLTFLFVAKSKKIEVLAYEGKAEGTVERSEGKFRVTRVKVQPRVTLKSGTNVEAAREAMKQTKETCFITNSILATVDLQPEFCEPEDSGLNSSVTNRSTS